MPRGAPLGWAIAFVMLALPTTVTGHSYTSAGPADRGNGQANGGSSAPAFSADGRFVAFVSRASNLVRGDSNHDYDVFVRDRRMGETTRVSVASDGTQSNAISLDASISGDGRFAAFRSRASNLVAHDSNNAPDIFEHDRRTGVTIRASVASDGAQANGGSYAPVLSADGRLVVFQSPASNLVPDDTNAKWDVFVHDRVSGVTKRVSVRTAGEQGNGNSAPATISAGGGFAAFWSYASNLVPGDTNGGPDVFVHDLSTGATTRIDAYEPHTTDTVSQLALSADGRFVALDTGASLVPADTNDKIDVFVHDRLTGSTVRASVSSAGSQGNDLSLNPALSADGRVVAFASFASNLVSGDTNQGEDVFVHDLAARSTRRVSVSAGGLEANAWSSGAALSGDGRLAGFVSRANNLVRGDTNHAYDAFSHDRLTRATARLSLGRGVPPVRECRVPKVVGLRLAQARQRLEQANCSSGTVRKGQRCRLCRVVRQRPLPGAHREAWARVRLWVR